MKIHSSAARTTVTRTASIVIVTAILALMRHCFPPTSHLHLPGSPSSTTGQLNVVKPGAGRISTLSQPSERILPGPPLLRLLAGKDFGIFSVVLQRSPICWVFRMVGGGVESVELSSRHCWRQRSRGLWLQSSPSCQPSTPGY
jgi:hypothetical protein